MQSRAQLVTPGRAAGGGPHPGRRQRQNAEVAPSRQRLESRLRKIRNLDVGESAFGPGIGYWVNGKEILHFDQDDVIDLRLTRAEIRLRAAALRSDTRVQLRRSSAADWLEIRLTGPDDVNFVVELVEVATAAHRQVDARSFKPPPTGSELERHRRFH